MASLCKTVPTSQDGKFAIARVSEGRYYLKAEATGYLEDVAVFDGSGKIEFSIQPGEQRNVGIRLLREASIRGRLLDERGQPIPDAEVRAFSEDFLVYRRPLWGTRMQSRGDTFTDRNGEFHIDLLTPGKYFLRAGFPVNKTEEALIRGGYLPAYYPDAATLKAAQPICVVSGTAREASFVVSPRKRYEVTGKLILPSGFNPKFEPIYGLQDESGEYVRQWQSDYNHASRVFTLRLPPGSFQLEIASGVYRTDLKARVTFGVIDANVGGLDMEMQVPLKLHGIVHFPDGFSPKTSFSTLLRLVLDGTGPIEEYGTEITKGGRITFTDLLPGHYTLLLFTNDAFYLKAAQFQEQDVVANGLTLGTDISANLDITLARATGELSGKVYSSTHAPAPVADVKLITRKDVPRVVMSTTTNGSGEFHITGVPPGKYELLALNEVVRDSEIGLINIDSLSNKPTQIEVTQSTKASVELEASDVLYVRMGCEAQQ